MMKRAFNLKPSALAVVAALGIGYSPALLAGGLESQYISNNITGLYFPTGNAYDVVEITPTGSISGQAYGLTHRGSIQSFNNYGSISADYYSIFNEGVIAEINNHGVIDAKNADRTIINLNSGTINKINNFGTISTPDASGKAIENTGVIGEIYNAGKINGDIRSTSTLVITGPENGMGILSGVPVEDKDRVGQIVITNGDLSFGSGNQWLNDNINLQNGWVNNDRANLFVSNPIIINGHYSQTMDASLNVLVASNAVTKGSNGLDQGYGRLLVNGTATILPSSTVNLVSQGYAFALGQRYVVIVATNILATDYNESTLKYSATEYTGKIKGSSVIDQGGKMLVVSLGDQSEHNSNSENNGGGNNSGGNDHGGPDVIIKKPRPTQPNATSSLAGLQKYSGVTDAGLLNLFNASLAISSTGEANKAGEQLSPGQTLSARTAVSTTTFDMLNVVGARVSSVQLARANGGQSGIAAGDDAADSAVWGQVFNGWVNQGTTDQMSGYKANYSGLVIGADRNITDEVLLGGAVSYTSTNVKGQDNASGSNSYVNSWGLTAYASYKAQDWYTGLYATTVNQNYRTQRQIDFTGYTGIANGKFDGQQYALKGEFGYPLALTQATTLTPLATLSYSYMRQDGYTETNGNGAALRVEGSNSDTLKSGLGAKLETTQATPWGDVVPYIQVLWGHQYDNKATDVTASYAAAVNETSFVTRGSTPEKDSVDVNVGATLLQSDTTSISAYYDISAAQDYTNQSISLRLRKLF